MTEERMIRIDYPDDAIIIKVALEFEYEQELPGLEWENLEPAPPKNWEELEAEYETKLAELRYQIGGMQMHLNSLKDFKPKCWYEHFSYHVEDENGPQMIDVYDCGICDIRDECIYKRE